MQIWLRSEAVALLVVLSALLPRPAAGADISDTSCNLVRSWRVEIRRGQLEATKQIVYGATNKYWGIRRTDPTNRPVPVVTVFLTLSDNSTKQLDMKIHDEVIVEAASISIRARIEALDAASAATGNFGPCPP